MARQNRLYQRAAMQNTQLFRIILLLCCCLELGSTFGRRLICTNTPNLTEKQEEICIRVPEAMPVMNDVMARFEDECSWQFKTSRWNCSNVTSPVYVDTGLEEGPESAFVYALTTAITVQKITAACYENKLGNYCRADNSRFGEESPEGWTWGSNYNITEGTQFVEQFLDHREIINMDSSDTDMHKRAVIHLHNNAVGKSVVLDNSKLKCVCHGVSGSCSIRTCTREIPSIFEIGDILRSKYDQAVRVNVVVGQNGDTMIQRADRRREQEGAPLSTELIYIETTTNHCSVDPEYTKSRHCLPQSELTTVSSKFYPPCEDFCCSGNYGSTPKTIVETCNCHFEFCCNLICDSCERAYTEFRCSGTSNHTSSDSLPTA